MKFCHYKKPLIWAGVLAAVVATSIPFWKGGIEPPVYKGQPLTYWAEKHPSIYYEACRVLGTNALPYLLSELDSTDPTPAVWLQRIASSILPVGEIFTRRKDRRYYARLGVQQLDTNAVPPLLKRFEALAAGEAPELSDLCMALSSLVSSNAQSLKRERYLQLLASENPEEKRVGCLGLAWTVSGPAANDFARILPLSSHADWRVRQAALIYCGLHYTHEGLEMPVIVAALTDTNASVRQLGLSALEHRGTNAVAAIPALLKLYSNAPAHLLSDSIFKSQLRQAIRYIDASLTPP